MNRWTNGHTIAAIAVGAGAVLIYQWQATRRARKQPAN